MTTSTVIYKGRLHTEAKHTKSAQIIETDAPIDNNGMGMAFSPTDLAATSLATCMMTVMGIEAEKKGIEIEMMEAEVYKIMAANPRRISGIKVMVTLKIDGDESAKEMLKNTGLNCPVALSLHPDLKQDIHFNFL